MTLDQLAHRIYTADCRFMNREPAEWKNLPERDKRHWRELGSGAAIALGVRVEPEMDPRYLAARNAMEACPEVGTGYLKDAIAKAIVAGIEADKRGG